jgi:hypothetical protein
MSNTDLKNLIERVQRWPASARDELLAVADQIEDQLKSGDYVASHEELEMIDSTLAAVDRGEIASEAEVEAAFAGFPASDK